MEYPVYYAMGQWQFSTDGITWQDTYCWGSNRFDFWPGWPYHEELDFLNASYDIRLKAEPQDLYTTGDPVYSNVIHINGGGSSAALHKLAAPTNLEWGKFYTDRSTGDFFSYPGMISWQAADTQHNHEYQITVYKNGEKVFWNAWYYRAGNGTYMTDWDFSLSSIEDCGSGEYYFTVQAIGDGETTIDSDIVKSASWTYTQPEAQLASPTGTKWDGDTATWNASPDSLAGGPVVMQLEAPLTIQTGIADGAEYDNKSDQNPKVLGGAVYVTEDLRIGGAGSLLYPNFGKFQYYTDSSKTQKNTADNHQLPFQVDGDLTVSRGITIEGGEMKVGGNVSNGLTAITFGGEACTEHSFGEWVVTTKPTCTEKGCTTHTCSRCGDSYTDTYTDALGHSGDDGVITKQPTESKTGVKTYTCTRCGATKTEDIPAMTKQNISFLVSSVNKTYGQDDFYNDTLIKPADCGALTYSSSNTDVAVVNAQSGKVTIQGAGDAVITVTAAAVENKYVETTASYTVKVGKASLTVTAKDHAITYGQKAGNAGFQADGFVNGENVGVLSGEAVYSYGTYKQYGNVGEYAISVSGLTARNYDITFASGKLTVVKATDYTITLGNLEQVAGHVSGVTAKIDPYDANAVLCVEYETENGWETTIPQESGSYPARAFLSDSTDNITKNDELIAKGTLTVKPGVTVNAGGDVSITVPYEQLPGLIDGKYAIACFVSDDGTVTYLIAHPDEQNRTITFTTTHFSTYAVFVGDQPLVTVNGGSGSGLYSAGATVTIAVIPDQGYTLEALTLTDKNGKQVSVTEKSGKYTFTMPASKVTVTATFMEDNSMLNFFVDVPADAYYYDAVLWAAENGITSGTSATTFAPDTPCTRAQSVTFLYRNYFNK